MQERQQTNYQHVDSTTFILVPSVVSPAPAILRARESKLLLYKYFAI